MSKLIVLSRFKESGNFWANYQKYYDKIIVYDKNPSVPNAIANVGRESHTYIHHILETYHDLPDEILFSQYNPKDHFSAKDADINSFLNGVLYDFIGIRPSACDYYLPQYRHKIPWIKLLKYIYGNEFNNLIVSRLVTTGITLNGIFRVTKEAILNYDINFYDKCLSLLNKNINPIEGFFFERIWKFLFTNYGYIDNNKYRFLLNRPLLYKHQSCKKIAFNNFFGHIILHHDGTISSGNTMYHSHTNEAYWSIKNNYLYFFHYSGYLTTRFDLSDMTDSFNQINGDVYHLSYGSWIKDFALLSTAMSW